MNDKMKNLAVRAASGAALVAVMFGATLWNRGGFAAMLAVVGAGCLGEFYAMARRAGLRPMRGAGFAAAACLFGAACGVQYDLIGATQEARPLVALLLLAVAVLLGAMPAMGLWRRSERPMADLGVTVFALAYVAAPVVLMLFLPLLLDAGGVWNPRAMCCFFVLIWANDVCAYLTGMAFGRRKLFERISPKKTWEGFFGGIAGALLAGWGASALLDAEAWRWLVLALVVAVTGVAGDLVESMFKRSVELKDSGRMLPGHGGWLDRFDALLLAAPFAFACLAALRIFGM